MMYERHPLSAAFPSMPESEIADLAESIRRHGQREAGVLYEGKILDGWHRYLACQLIDGEFFADEFPEGDDPVAFVIARNAFRRHLSASQRAASIALCVQWRDKGGDYRSALSTHRSGATVAEMAKQAGVSESTVKKAKAGIEAGLGEALVNGTIGVKRAEEIAKLPESERAEAIETKPKRKPKKVLGADYEALLAKYNELTERMPELIQLAESAIAFENNEDFKEMQVLRATLRAVELTRDHLMRENVELKKEVRYWRKKAGAK